MTEPDLAASAAIGGTEWPGPAGGADVAGHQAPGYCHHVNAPGTGAGAPGGGVGRDPPPDQARLGQLAEEQAALRRVATLVAQATPPEEVFAAVTEEVGRLLAVDFAILVRYDPQDTLEVVGTWIRTGAPAPTPVGGRLPLGGRNVTTLVYQTGRPARINYSDVSGVIGQVASRDWGLRSSVGVPVSVESRLWGCIVIAFSGQGPLPADTEARLASFTELVATAIANADSRAELARLAEEQAALRRVATLVARGLPPEEVFAAVAEEVGRLLPAGYAHLARYEPDRTLTTVAAWGAATVGFPVGSRRILEGNNLSTLVLETGRPARIDHYADASGAVGAAAQAAGLRSAVATPIIVEGRLWGLIVAGSILEQPLPRGHRGAAGLVHGVGGDGDREYRVTCGSRPARRGAGGAAAGGHAGGARRAARRDLLGRQRRGRSPVRGAGGGPQIRARRPGNRLRRRLEDPRTPGRDAMGVPAGNGFGGGLSHRMLRPCRRDGLVVGQRAPSREPHVAWVSSRRSRARSLSRAVCGAR